MIKYHDEKQTCISKELHESSRWVNWKVMNDYNISTKKVGTLNKEVVLKLIDGT